MNIAEFKVDTDKCIGCGMCVKVCPGGILYLNGQKKAAMTDISDFGWNGCWRCEHCLSVCPAGAVSIFGKTPEQSAPSASRENMEPVFKAMVASRHSCRRYLDKNVDKGEI